MKYPVKIILIISFSFLIISITGLWNGEKLYSQIGFFLGLCLLALGVFIIHIQKIDSAKVFGFYILVLVSTFIWLNYQSAWGIESVVFLGKENIKLTIRTLFYIFILGFSFFCLTSSLKFKDLIKRNVFYLTSLLLLAYLVTEIPIYGVHADFGGIPHGHSIWKGFHLH